MSFSYEEVKQAYERIRPYIRKTPLEQSFYLGDEIRNYFFKLESCQRAKSFKIRGALNKMMTLTDEEKRTLPEEMGAIIAFANQLEALDTDGVPITAHVVPMKNVFREDEPETLFTRDELLTNAPTTDGDYMTVPKTVV